MSNDWPFDQPPNCATVTSAHVMRKGELITHVYHDEADHGWQFHASEGTSMEDAMLVALEEIVRADPSVLELATLPPGWMATRTTRHDAWIRKETYGDAPKILIDWATIRTPAEFYEAVLPQCKSPAWHGRNLAALRDSWVTGSINPEGPPYQFEIRGEASLVSQLSDFRDAVIKIAQESVDENGGALRRIDEVS